jgi:hypothetical protein
MITAVISVVLIIGGINAGGRPALYTCIGLVLALAVAIAVYLRRSRIRVTSSEISARGLWFHRRRDRAQAASVVRATVVHPGATAETIVVFDAGRHAMLTINGALYSSTDLDRLVDHLGLPTDAPDGPVTLPQLGREQPGSVSWIGRHPVAFTLLCALGFAVLAVVLGTVVWALTG